MKTPCKKGKSQKVKGIFQQMKGFQMFVICKWIMGKWRKPKTEGQMGLKNPKRRDYRSQQLKSHRGEGFVFSPTRRVGRTNNPNPLGFGTPNPKGLGEPFPKGMEKNPIFKVLQMLSSCQPSISTSYKIGKLQTLANHHLQLG